MAEDSSFPARIVHFKLDPKKMGYRGPIVGKEFEKGQTALFPENTPTFYTPHVVVSHYGKTDFSVHFGRFEIFLGEFIADLVIIFSYGEIVRFLETLKKQFKNDKTPTVQKLELSSNNNESEKIIPKMVGMLFGPQTLYFSPNKYLVLATNDIQIYFGRLMGETEGKTVSLFICSTIFPVTQLKPIISAIETNIAKFEEKYNVKIAQLTPKVLTKEIKTQNQNKEDKK